MITKYHLIAFLIDHGITALDAKAVANRITDAVDAHGGRPFEIGLIKYHEQLDNMADLLDQFIAESNIDENVEVPIAPVLTVPAPVQP